MLSKITTAPIIINTIVTRRDQSSVGVISPYPTVLHVYNDDIFVKLGAGQQSYEKKLLPTVEIETKMK
jgi:hypothetical protein